MPNQIKANKAKLFGLSFGLIKKKSVCQRYNK